MATQPPGNELEINVNMGLQRALWTIQRVSWAVALVVLILIFLGITGDGPLAATDQADEQDRLKVQYPRFARNSAPTTMQLVVAPPEGASEVQIQVEQRLVDQYRIEQITPEPDSSTLDNDHLILAFPVESSTDDLEIHLRLVPRSPGYLSFEIGRVDGPSFKISQLVYP